VITATPTRGTAAPMTSKWSGWNPSVTMLQATSGQRTRLHQRPRCGQIGALACVLQMPAMSPLTTPAWIPIHRVGQTVMDSFPCHATPRAGWLPARPVVGVAVGGEGVATTSGTARRTLVAGRQLGGR
jgi:hypothetical protein